MRPLIKFFITLGAFAIMIIGLALLALTVLGYINNTIFIGDDSTKWIVLGIMLTVSLAIITSTGAGIYGICKENPKKICTFQIVVIIFMIIFFALGVGLVILPDYFLNGSCTSSSNIVIEQANNIYNLSAESFCKSCPCTISNDRAVLQGRYSDTNDIDYIIANYPSTATGANNTQDCIKDKVSPAEVTLFTTIGQLQDLLSCSLWCKQATTEPNLIYRFKDVNSGKPAGYCYDRIESYFNDYNYYAKIVTFSAGGVLLLMFICNMYICCSPQKKNKRLRERFMMMEDEDDRDDYRRYRDDRDDRDDYRRRDDRRDDRRDRRR